MQIMLQLSNIANPYWANQIYWHYLDEDIEKPGLPHLHQPACRLFITFWISSENTTTSPQPITLNHKKPIEDVKKR